MFIMRRTLLLFSVAGALMLPSTAESRPASKGITIALTRARPGALVCAGFCPQLDLTLWDDGEALVNGGKRVRVSTEQAYQFRAILRPFRPAEPADRSRLSVSRSDCSVRVQWPANREGFRPTACGDGPLFEAILRVLRSINLDAFGNPAN